MEEWSSSKKSLKDWVELLQATTANVTEEEAKAELVINHQDIIKMQDETNVHLSRKKPAKRKLENFVELGIDVDMLAQPSPIFTSDIAKFTDSNEAATIVDETLKQFDLKI